MRVLSEMDTTESSRAARDSYWYMVGIILCIIPTLLMACLAIALLVTEEIPTMTMSHLPFVLLVSAYCLALAAAITIYYRVVRAFFLYTSNKPLAFFLQYKDR